MEQVATWISQNPFWSAIIFFVFTYVIEISKIEINPWTWVARRIGNAVNKPVLDKIDGVNDRIDKMEKRIADTEEKTDTRDADLCRRRILRFSDECRRSEKHSEEFFNDVMDDITMYRKYCEDHPKYVNEKAKNSIAIIDEAYQHCLRTGDFL